MFYFCMLQYYYFYMLGRIQLNLLKGFKWKQRQIALCLNWCEVTPLCLFDMHYIMTRWCIMDHLSIKIKHCRKNALWCMHIVKIWLDLRKQHEGNMKTDLGELMWDIRWTSELDRDPSGRGQKGFNFTTQEKTKDSVHIPASDMRWICNHLY